VSNPTAPPHRSRGVSEYFPNEGTPLSPLPHRALSKYDSKDSAGGRFGVEYSPAPDIALMGRERDLMQKLHELLASPFGEAMARIVEESYRLLPQARVAGGYE
jgi:hypothetical protein